MQRGGDNDNADQTLYKSDEFRMYSYKIKRCPNFRNHDWTSCPFAHRGEKANRRDPRFYHYAAILCPDFRDGENCKNGDLCKLAHGVFEYWLHPARYRTQLCTSRDLCTRKVCFFAHTEDELRPEIQYMWYSVYDDPKPYYAIGYECNGNVVILTGPPRVAPPPADTQRRVDCNGTSEVEKSLAMLNIKNGHYEKPKIVGRRGPDSDHLI